jgi:hypothetical protein
MSEIILLGYGLVAQQLPQYIKITNIPEVLDWTKHQEQMVHK